MPAADEITKLLAATKRGDAHAESDLMTLVYGELSRIAERHMRQERKDHTLQPTALVNEAYIRLMGQQAKEWSDWVHFFASASTVMRRILVDHARHRDAAKSPGGKQKVELRDGAAASRPSVEDLLALYEALARLAEWNTRQARLVEMIYFGGLTEEEAAGVLGISIGTVERDWRAARVWLQSQLATKPA